MFVLIGNCRRFTGARTAQANVEDGLLEIELVRDTGDPEISAIEVIRLGVAQE